MNPSPCQGHGVEFSTADGSDSRESRNGSCYCRFWVLFILIFSRLSWFCRILLSSSYDKAIKAAVLSKDFTHPTVRFRISSFITTVWKMLFRLCTVISCCLDSREPKNHVRNCRPTTRPTVHMSLFLLPTVHPTVVIPKTKKETVDQAPGQQFICDHSCFLLSTRQ